MHLTLACSTCHTLTLPATNSHSISAAMQIVLIGITTGKPVINGIIPLFRSGLSVCLRKCCLTDEDLPMTQDTIVLCQNNINHAYMINIVVICSIIGSILLFGGFVFLVTTKCEGCNRIAEFCRNCTEAVCRCCICFFNCFKRQPTLENNSYALNNQNYSHQIINVKGIRWEKTAFSFDFCDMCSICLCEASNVRLPCLHLYHRQCIATSMVRRMECPLCRGTDFSVF